MILKYTNNTRMLVRKACIVLYFIHGPPLVFSILGAQLAASRLWVVLDRRCWCWCRCWYRCRCRCRRWRRCPSHRCKQTFVCEEGALLCQGHLPAPALRAPQRRNVPQRFGFNGRDGLHDSLGRPVLRPRLSTLQNPFVWRRGVLSGYSSTRVSLWDSLLSGRLAMGLATVRASRYGTRQCPGRVLEYMYECSGAGAGRLLSGRRCIGAASATAGPSAASTQTNKSRPALCWCRCRCWCWCWCRCWCGAHS